MNAASRVQERSCTSLYLFSPGASLLRRIAFALTALSSTAAATTFPEIVVTGSRTAERVEETLTEITVIDREAIERAGATTLIDLLSRTPGARFAQNGGMGASAALFLRGAEARHTLLLVDGVRLGSATTGQPTLEAIPLEAIERIEIVRGPASALYGSEAIGGVIHIVTRRTADRFTPHLLLGVGSNATHRLVTSAVGRDGALRYTLTAGSEGTQGIDARDPATLDHPPDADGFRNRFATTALTWALTEHTDLDLTAYLSRGRNDYDSGAGRTWILDYDSYLLKELTAASLALRQRFDTQWHTTLRLGHARDQLTDRSSATARTHFYTHETQFIWEHEIALPLGNLFAAYDQRDTDIDSTIPYTVTQRTLRALTLGWLAERGSHRWQINARRDHNNQFGTRTTGLIAYGYHLTPTWQLRLSAATAYNAPTFNQLYWPDTGFGGGNPELRPEFARNREIGLRWRQGDAHFTVAYYDNRVKDLIAGWPPRNINRARLQGIETIVGGRNDPFSWQIGADWLDAIDETTGLELPRRAPLAFSGMLSLLATPWHLGFDLSAVDRRFDNSRNSVRLSGYSRLDLWVHRSLTPDWRLELRANNLFDRTYQTAAGYLQPGRELFLALRYLPR
ncbi:MAG: TonB-dependent receptor [Hydrogenophilus sp.]|nr:TonB-dependent receptor [Hydrogenophilus sp.]